MIKEVFNRYEHKYLIDKETFLKMLKQIEKYMEVDEYNRTGKPYPIHNIYFDTRDYDLIRTSLSKPIYKEKVRIRSYIPFERNEIVFLEIKKKYKGLVNKRRTRIVLKDALDFIENKKNPNLELYMNEQVVKELDYIFQTKTLYPKAKISYDRIAFYNKDVHDLRITFDFNICSKKLYDNIYEESETKYLLGKQKILMEVKAEQSIPIWLSNILAQNKIYSISCSKYGLEYQYRLQEKIRVKERR